MPEPARSTAPVDHAAHAPPPKAFEPYIPAKASLPELTPLPLIFGTLMGTVFGLSSLYLVLKVGLTVSASIPVAVLAIAIMGPLRKLVTGQSSNILQNNIAQTAGSAGESIAFGVGVTMPAIMILGFDLEVGRVMLVAVLGGLLGILMMIPLRRALIVEQHGVLKYPEGTACAEVLKAGASKESREAHAGASEQATAATGDESRGGKLIFTGFGIGLLYKTAMAALKGWKEVPEKVFGAPLKAASVSAEISPELLGVGYIIGPRVAGTMVAGGVLAYLVLIPLIKFFGDGVVTPGNVPIREMGPSQIRGAYILYIGAGAVAAGGIISLARSLPIIWQGLSAGLKDVKIFQKAGLAMAGETPRTDRDLSMKLVGIGLVVLLSAIALATPLHMNLLGALLIVVFGFLFVTVSSRLTGEIGSSSNPISGMTVATLLLTCGIFVLIGWTGPSYYVTALSVGAIVCIAASNGGTTSQDLKTGFLVGATPKYQQVAILVGALLSALALGPVLLGLNDTGTVYVPPVTFEKAASERLPENVALSPYDGALPHGGGTFQRFALEAEKGGLGPGEYLVGADGKVQWRVQRNFSGELSTDPSKLSEREKLIGPQGSADPKEYLVWHKLDDVGGPAGKYLVDDGGRAVYLVDPGINGVHAFRPDGSRVQKFDAPKATLMSYIIKGILNQQLPWGLVLLGVMIAITLELAGIPSLAFAVGVYLPISSSSPIFIGGMVRWLVDRYLRRKHAGRKMTEEELLAEGDKSPGVLLASGYIAGGAIAGILIAFLAAGFPELARSLEEWASEHNPFFAGSGSDLLALLPFAALVALLYLVGRERLMRGRHSP